MPREYKLRLGDGTVMAVDEQGLRTWVVDGQAEVQSTGSRQWRPLKEVLAEVAATAPRSGPARERLDDGIPTIPLKPLDDEPPPRAGGSVRARGEGKAAPVPRAAGLLGSLSAWVARLTRRSGAAPASSSGEPEPAWARAERSEPRQPPPPVGALSTVRLAEADEQEEAELDELYEEDSGVGVLSLAWLWLKRLVLIAALVAAGVGAVNTWPTWLPVVTQVSVVVFKKIHEYLRSDRATAPEAEAEKQRQMEEALQQATSQLPHLSRETIQLVMSSSLWNVPDPPEVFSRAYVAARRGSSALAPSEADELKALESTLFGALRPADRQRAREYDHVRLQRATLPTEDREMLGLFARGTRALPAQGRQRLQALLGKAVAAGLTSGGA